MAASSLTRTNTSPSASGYKYTFSAWIKRSKLTDRQMFWRVINPSATTYYSYMEFQANDTLHILDYSSNGTLAIVTNRLFRDTSAWYHIMGVVDTTEATASNGVKLYVNGTQETSFASTTYTLGQNQATTGTESGKNNYVGGDAANNLRFFNGYMSHVAFVDGQALTPTSFGQTDSSSGIWKFKSPTGITFGNNGYHLKFENSGNLGLDSSGEGHNLTVSGNGRQALDTPSNVHCTFNPLIITSAGGVAVRTPGFQDGNTTALFDDSGNNEFALTTIAPSKGKWYAEFKWANATGNAASTVGIVKSDFVLQTDVNDQGIVYKGDGNKVVNNSSSSYGASWTTGDIIGIALDCDSNTVNFYKNSVAQGSISIDADTNWYIFCSSYALSSTTRSVNANFGNGYFGTTAISSAGSNGNGSLFEYDVPSGYYALNTKNINTYG